MSSAVATPLENQFSTIAGLEQMTSVNSPGSTQITLEFALTRGLHIDGLHGRASKCRSSPCVEPSEMTWSLRSKLQWLRIGFERVAAVHDIDFCTRRL